MDRCTFFLICVMLDLVKLACKQVDLIELKDGYSFRIPTITKYLDLERTALHTSVNLVRGKLVGINRVEKFVHLEDGTRTCYDLLILTPGREYFVPMPLAITSVDRFGRQKVFFLSASLFFTLVT